MEKEKNSLIENIIGRSRDVLNREKAEDIRLEANEALCEREAVLNAIFEAASDAILVLNIQGRYVDVNPAACSIFGYTREEMLASDISALFFPEDMKQVSIFDKKTLLEGEPIPECRMRKKDGREIWAEVAVKPLKMGCCEAVLTVVRDITDKRLSALALREERDRAQKYFDVAGVVLLVLDSSGEVSMINRKGCEVLESAENEIIGKNWFDAFLPEKDREILRSAFKDVINGKEIVEYHEGSIVTRSGRLRLIAWHNTVLKDERCRVYATLSSGNDITESRKAEEALLQARFELEKKVKERTEELLKANKTLTDQAQRVKRAEEIIRTVVEGTAALSGDEYFRSLVRCLASALRFKYALVGEIDGPGRERIKTLALWAGGGLADNIEYELSGTPCENVVGKELCVYPDKVQELFPKDRLLVDMGIKSYIGTPLADSSGKPTGILVAFDDKPMRDVEEAESILRIFGARASLEIQRRRTEVELGKSMEMLQAIIDNSGAVIFLKDENGRFLLVNRWYEESFGLSKDQILGKTDFDLSSEEIASRFREHDRQVIESGRTLSFEEVARTRDGVMRTYITVKFPIPSIPGSVCGIATDITDRIRIEEELKKSEDRFEEAQEIARIGSWEWDSGRDSLYWSDEIYRIFGINPGEFEPTYEKFLNIVHPEDRAFIEAAIDEALKGARPYSFDHRIVLPDGTVRIVHGQGRVVRAENGSHIRIAGTCQDVTETRLSEAQLKESEKKFRGLIETIPLGISITNEQGDFLEANTALWKIFGYSSKEDLMARKVQALYCYPSDRARVAAAIKQGLAKELEVRVKRKDGTEFLGFVTAMEQTLKDGTSRFLGLFQDVTERKKVEAELLKAQKLESIGVLAGGIAHDFNNLLLGILGYVSVAKEQVEKDQKVYQVLSEIEKSAIKTKGLARQLLTFSKGGEPVRGTVSIEEIVRSSAELILRGKNLKNEIEFETGLMEVDADEGQISQAMNNIIMNAEQAVEPGKGHIRISAQNIHVTSAENLPLSEGDYVKVSVVDNGHGIPRKYLGKVFDPFFTTRKKASGLGLSVTYSIIKKHNGHITVESDEGKGAAFHVYLPASGSQASSQPGIEKIGPGAGRVLVMDDEELVRDVAGEMLSILGYEPVFAKKGEEAVEAYKQAKAQGAPFDAVILDLTVPDGMGGLDTVKKLLQIDPSVKAIVSSGYSKDPVMSDFRKYGFSGVIAKPYRVAEFGSAVKTVIDAKKP